MARHSASVALEATSAYSHNSRGVEGVQNCANCPCRDLNARPKRAMEVVMICGSQLILKRASASRPSGEWNNDDYDVLANGIVIGRIMNAAAAPVGSSWLWTASIRASGNLRTAIARRRNPPNADAD